MGSKTKTDKIISKYICENLEIAPGSDKTRECILKLLVMLNEDYWLH